jgi:hypothetical protein
MPCVEKEKCELIGHSEWVIQEHVLWSFWHRSGIVALHVYVYSRGSAQLVGCQKMELMMNAAKADKEK